MIEKKLYENVDVLSKYKIILDQVDPLRPSGKIEEVSGMALYSIGPEVKIGEICRVLTTQEGSYLPCEVVGFKGNRVVLMPMGPTYGVYPGCTVLATGRPLTVPVSDKLLGRVLDGTGAPIDEKGAIFAPILHPIDQDPPSPFHRKAIRHPLATGVRVVDGMLTVGRGQRIGIFAGSGVGKSTLLGMIARNTEADVNVVALVGERGREPWEFIENEMADVMHKSVVIVATSDRPAIQKISCAMIATTIAEYFRDQGKDVNLMMDSVTRFAMAQREVGASTMEPVIQRGYPPSVFAKLSRLVERAGTGAKGSITGFYTVLVDADDMNDPVADATRGYLDGHIWLSRKMASAGQFPAVDVIESISRLMPKVTSEEHRKWATFMRKLLAAYRENEDFIKLGTYSAGSDQVVDQSIELNRVAPVFLNQDVEEKAIFSETLTGLKQIYRMISRDESD